MALCLNATYNKVFKSTSNQQVVEKAQMNKSKGKVLHHSGKSLILLGMLQCLCGSFCS
jgi:hypothetical protein